MSQPACQTPARADATAPPWHVLVADDDPLFQSVTCMALDDTEFMGRPLRLHPARSAAEARCVLAAVPDIAVALVDMFMESEYAGLMLVDHIRRQLGNRSMRIVLRTGRQGDVSEGQALAEHDINAYLDKAATDSSRLHGAVLTALRSYHEVHALYSTIDALQTRSITDPLTGLYNAGHLASTLARVLCGAQRRGEPVSVVFLDVDDFKLINDKQGHLRGDEVLAQVGKALRDNSRLEDNCFRYGGDEFVVVLPNCSLAQVEQHYLPRLLQALHALGLCVSHGACEDAPAGTLGAQELLRRADERMYARKRLHQAQRQAAAAGAVAMPRE